MYLYGLETIGTLLLSIVGFGVVLFAQFRVNSAYSKYKKITSKSGISGCEVARQILDTNGLTDVHVVETTGELSDHYDPTRKVVRLSKDIFHGTTIAALSVAAHECGHAIQDKEGYKFMRIRSSLVPVVNLISYLGYFVSIFTLIMGVVGYLKIAILILLSTVVFQLVTLPVEFDASKRAKVEIEKLGLADSSELNGVSSMLGAAAMTYVASLVSSLMNLLRLLLMLSSRDND